MSLRATIRVGAEFQALAVMIESPRESFARIHE